MSSVFDTDASPFVDLAAGFVTACVKARLSVQGMDLPVVGA